MSKYSDIPVYWVNRWITQVLRDEEIIPLEADYVTDLDMDEDFELPFMMAAQSSSEITTPYHGGQYNVLPYVVWTAEQKGGHDQPWNNCWNVTYIFYANDVSKVLEIANAVHDLTNREDWSATDINHFYRNDALFPWDFKTISFTSGSGPAPAQDEGGRNAYMTIIECSAINEGTGRDNDYGAVTGLGRI